MIAVTYVSASNVAGDIAEVLRIRDQAITRNKANGVTGVLYCDSEFFFQVLEGERAEVLSTMRRICRDRRHKDVNVIDGKDIEVRRFKNWSMKFVSGISNPAMSQRFDRRSLLNCDRNYLTARLLELAEM